MTPVRMLLKKFLPNAGIFSFKKIGSRVTNEPKVSREYF